MTQKKACEWDICEACDWWKQKLCINRTVNDRSRVCAQHQVFNSSWVSQDVLSYALPLLVLQH
jgi:hypothetical protein